jgi:hypothetical protein
MTTTTITFKKACGGCTACCSGTLTGSAHGMAFWKGRPCHFMGCNGCSIYEDRPADPCKSYECGYLKFDWVPQWMRPDLSDVIITERKTKTKQIPFLEVAEYKGKMNAEVLSFLFMSKFNGHFENFTYQINGGWNRVGSKEFLDDI